MFSDPTISDVSSDPAGVCYCLLVDLIHKHNPSLVSDLLVLSCQFLMVILIGYWKDSADLGPG
jgi:hypothetical protein